MNIESKVLSHLCVMGASSGIKNICQEKKGLHIRLTMLISVQVPQFIKKIKVFFSFV